LGTTTAVSSTGCIAFSADGRKLAVGRIITPTRHREIWDFATGTVALTPGGSLPGVNDRDWNLLQIWDVATGKVALTPEGFLPGVHDVAYSPDGKLLAAAIGTYDGMDGAVCVWDAATGQLVCNLRGHFDGVWGVAFSPDGKRLASASGGWDGKTPGDVKIWDIQTAQELCTLRGHTDTVFGVSFSPDGRRLATAGGDGLRIWDGTPLAETPVRDTRPADK
jgi:WD40 repeat protein